MTIYFKAFVWASQFIFRKCFKMEKMLVSLPPCNDKWKTEQKEDELKSVIFALIENEYKVPHR